MFGRTVENGYLRWIFLTVSLCLGSQRSESADITINTGVYPMVEKNTRALRENCLMYNWDQISYNIILTFISILLLSITAYTTWMYIYREIRHILSYVLNNIS
uniref:Membrane protein a149 n=1 Tax=Mastomys natalensis cytomegalovirus 1 TaxID=2973541 RepID=A0A9Y1ILE0_9BETA|nr:membrane protein a149 [Mastomys natalensis cytomegalovirus 1]WEG68998.1 membrane protein a149 [Mastomys natalensis cytomegalovirus 1]WEG71226.1 membrane protein a149 [Mastomys natalensis cytomegalovirus 1]